MIKKICFDMDGTIANLYGVENWLAMLQSADPTPYEAAEPMLHLSTLARLFSTLVPSPIPMKIYPI